MIWDLHVHLTGVEGRTPEERMPALLRYADGAGVDRLVVYMGYPMLVDPTPEELRIQNDQVLAALSHHHDRAYGFVYLSARHVEASLAEFERCVANGPMLGIKLWVARRCDTPDLDPIVRRAAELKAPIFQHTWEKTAGNMPGESSSVDLANLARRHPEATFFCGHTGGNWSKGLRAIRGSPNVLADTAGSDPTSGFVEAAVRELGADRVAYGSDVGGRSFASQLAKVRGARVDDEAKAKILGGNLKRVLTPILRAKGRVP